MRILSLLKKPQTLGAVAGIFARFTGRTDIVLGKILLKKTGPVFLAFIEIFAAMVMITFYMGIKTIWKQTKQLDRCEVITMVACSILSSVLGPLFFLRGLDETTGINASLLVNLNPLFLGLFAVFFLKEEFTKHLLLGGGLMLFGILVLSTRGFTEHITFNFGDIFIMCSAASYSGGDILFKKYIHTKKLDLLVGLRAIIGSSILGLMVALFFREDVKSIIHLQGYLGLILIYAFVAIIITLTLHYWALENISLLNNALIGISSPIIGIIYSNVFLEEAIIIPHVVSVAIIMIGLVVTKIDLIKKTLFKTKMKLKHVHSV